MTDLHNFNPGKKSWKMYAKELTSINGDDLTLIPYSGNMMNIKSGKTSFKNTNNVQKMLVDTSNEIILDCSGDAKFNDARIGNITFSGFADIFTAFTANNYFNTSDYALLQRNDNGQVYINAPSSAAIYFRNNNSYNRMTIDSNGVGIAQTNSHAVSDSNYALNVVGDMKVTNDISCSNHISCYDASINNNLDVYGDGRFGNAQLGTWNDPTYGNLFAVFGAKDQIVTNTNYALLQDNIYGDTYLNAPSGRSIHFKNNNSVTNMIINANGVGIGATPNASYKLLVNGDISCNKIYVDEIHTDKIISRINSTAKIFTGAFPNAPTLYWFAKNTNGDEGIIEALQLDFGTVFPSDDNLKHNEITIPNSIDIIKLLKPRKYIQSSSIDYDASHNDSKERFGFIAQDVEAIPELVNVVEEIPDKNYATNNTMIKALDYNSLFTISVKALKEVITKVEEQQTTIESQNTKINNLENENLLIKTKLNEILTELGKSTI